METLILDTPSAKKRRVVDMPIYLQFCVCEGKNRWYVIESRCGSEDTAPGDDELGDEHYISKSEQDRVRSLPLPDFNFDIDFDRAALVASKSRLFIVSHTNNEILYIDLQQRSNQEWKRCDSWVPDREIVILSGAAVSDDGDWIYTVQNKVIRFRCDNVQDWKKFPDVIPDLYCFDRPRFLLALSSESKMLMYGPSPKNDLDVMAGFYDLESDSWTTMIDSFPIGFADWRDLPTRAVLVRDSFLIYYSDFHPDLHPLTKQYCPALYVYDIRHKKWLSEPVQGIADLPGSPDYLFHASVMQVRRDVLKLAFVWSAMADEDQFYWSPEDNIYMEQTEVHWSKFILRIEENETQDIPPTFHAEGLSSGTIYGGDTRLIKSTAGMSGVDFSNT